MKYLLKNNKTKEETICEKVKIDGFEYYVENTVPFFNDWLYDNLDNRIWHLTNLGCLQAYHSQKCNNWSKIIATNNPNIDIPKIINEFENLAEQDADKCEYYKHPNSDNGYYDHVEGFKAGYNKAKETYQFTEENVLEFALFCANFALSDEDTEDKTRKELLDIWKEQQIKTIYYE